MRALDELRLAARRSARRARQLHAVRRVEDHRIADLAHDRQAAHVHHQIVVAERDAALGQQDLVVAGGRHLVAACRMSCGRDELALLDVHDAARAAGCDQQVGLAAEERGDLQNIHDFGRGIGLRGLVNVGEHGNAAACDARRESEAFARARARGTTRRCCGWLCRRRL